jgi:hypothetical protein
VDHLTPANVEKFLNGAANPEERQSRKAVLMAGCYGNAEAARTLQDAMSEPAIVVDRCITGNFAEVEARADVMPPTVLIAEHDFSRRAPRTGGGPCPVLVGCPGGTRAATAVHVMDEHAATAIFLHGAPSDVFLNVAAYNAAKRLYPKIRRLRKAMRHAKPNRAASHARAIHRIRARLRRMNPHYDIMAPTEWPR